MCGIIVTIKRLRWNHSGHKDSKMHKEQSTFFSFQAISQQFGDSIKNIKAEKNIAMWLFI